MSLLLALVTMGWDAGRSDISNAVSSDGMTVTGYGTTTDWHITLATCHYTTGKYYFETSVTTTSSSTDGSWSIGFANASLLDLHEYLGET